MFFKSYYKPGPGISKDAKAKKGYALFWDIIMREFWTIIWLNLLLILTSIPLVTIGPSICAVNYVCAKIMRDEPVDVWSDYMHGFKINFKQGLLIGFLILFIFGALSYAYFFYAQLIGYAAYAILVLIILFGVFNIYILPIASIINLPTKAIFKNSALMTILCAKSTFFSTITNGAIIFAGLYFYPVSVLYYIVIGISFTIFLNLFFIYDKIEKYVLPHDDIEEETDENFVEYEEIEQSDANLLE